MMEFFRYTLVGIFNTCWGYFLIFGFMFVFAWSPETSNAAGYAIALGTSYLLNRRFTFKSKNLKRYEFGRFLLVFAMAYIANIFTLLITVRILEWNPYLAQIISGGVYVVSSYLLNRIFVFKSVTSSAQS